MMAGWTQRFPLRFGMQTLLALVAVIAIASLAANWAYRNSVRREAALAYQTAYAAWDTDAVTPSAVCAASEIWLAAEVRVPFTDATIARRAHLDRITTIRDRFKATVYIALWNDPKAPTRQAAELDAFHERARQGIQQ